MLDSKFLIDNQLPPGFVPFEADHIEAIMDDQVQQYWRENAEALMQNPGYTMMKNGEPLLSTGIIELWPGVGETWLVTSSKITDYPISVARTVRNGMRWMIEKKGYWRVQANVQVGWPVAERFAYWMGMKSEGLMPKFGLDQADHWRFAWVKD